MRKGLDLFHQAVETSPVSMLIADKEGRIVEINAAAESLFGYPRGELLGEVVEMLIPPRFRVRHPALRESYLESPNTRRMALNREVFALRKDGREFPIELGLNIIESPEGTLVVASLTDISHRKRTEADLQRLVEERTQELQGTLRALTKMMEDTKDANERLAKTNRELKNARKQVMRSAHLAAVGQLGAGAAHELNNPLTGILGLTQVLLRDLRKNDKHRGHLLDMERELRRCTLILRDLMEFSRQESPDHELEDVLLPATITKALSLIRYQLPKRNIRLETDMEPDLPPVRAEGNRLEQVFLNLLTNARDALSEKGGTIRISAKKYEGRIRAVITDTGAGIPPAMRKRIFDPFFTTKRVGSGIGLGLSVSSQIVRQFGGNIHVDSTPGRGTTVTIVLPAAPVHATPSRKAMTL